MSIIGFIGLGIMGESMCERIIRTGNYRTIVYDINQGQIEKLKDVGAIPAISIEEVGHKADIIIIMVPNSQNVEEVVLTLLPALTRDKIVVDMSTISPQASQKLAEKVSTTGAEMIDAPVVKSKGAAISGDLGIYVGGKPAVLEKVKPVLKCMGSEIIHLGNNGAGLVMKLCHNMLVAQIQNGVNEMLLLAQKNNINTDDFIKAVSYGGGQNFYLDTKGETIKNKDFSPKFPFGHMAKDIALGLELITENNLDLPATTLVNEVYTAGMAEGFNREDFSAAYKVVEKKALTKN